VEKNARKATKNFDFVAEGLVIVVLIVVVLIVVLIFVVLIIIVVLIFVVSARCPRSCIRRTA
jgi:hypothetical protein